ncbi:MAG TPA: hypothetical protein VF175_13920 [Lacipirellula sp.]
MNTLKLFTVLGLSVVIFSGCSAETKQEAQEALEATGEAASAAIEDTKENVNEAAEAIDARIDGDEETAGDDANEAPADDSPADANTVPESEEPSP